MVHRIVNGDKLHPLEYYKGFGIRPGYFSVNGAVEVPGGVSFTIYSHSATSCELLLFKRYANEPYAIIPFPDGYKIGDVYSMIVFGLNIELFEYCFRLDGPFEPEKGLLFDPQTGVLDPYAKAVTGQSQWGIKPFGGKYPYRARVVSSDFDWNDESNPNIDFKDLVIYEMHVRGFTIDPSSNVTAPGTFQGVREKIPYLKELGVNAVELLPVFEFDEMNCVREFGGQQLLDYWGYNPVSFFAPNTAYTSGLEFNREGDELKSLIRELHNNGIEVILDVVYNHTAEGGFDGKQINFKGLDNNVYYLLGPDGNYHNFSGCGNTVNCNHPVVRELIRDSLRYWTTEYRVDGFRFDLASILARDENGEPMQHPPLLENLARDPILQNVKLIAEAWDAGGMYQVGTFPSWRRWAEWNGKYRDDLRRFLKGDNGMIKAAGNRIVGSPDIYSVDLRGTDVSVNFLTCHDGFTMYDLYSYNTKHNLSNGWDNTDGENNNNSWNCGVEGDTQDPVILELRRKMVRNAFTVLMSSRGAALFLAGDEFLNTQFGNNNAYCQDNPTSWLDWEYLDTRRDHFEFVKRMIRVRRDNPILRRHVAQAECGFPNFSFHGVCPFEPDTRADSHYLGVMFASRDESHTDDDIAYLALNTHWETHTISLPRLPDHYKWRMIVNTAETELEQQIYLDKALAPTCEDVIVMQPRSVVLLINDKMDDKVAPACEWNMN